MLNERPVQGLTPAERARIRNREIGFIFQSFNLIGDLTVYENVELPLTYRGMPSSERRARVEEALEKVGMGHRAKHVPSQLSGGQQQRVAVARALAGYPSVLLADEPTGNLDSKNGDAVMDLMKSLHKTGSTILMGHPRPALTCTDYNPARTGRVRHPAMSRRAAAHAGAGSRRCCADSAAICANSMPLPPPRHPHTGHAQVTRLPPHYGPAIHTGTVRLPGRAPACVPHSYSSGRRDLHSTQKTRSEPQNEAELTSVAPVRDRFTRAQSGVKASPRALKQGVLAGLRWPGGACSSSACPPPPPGRPQDLSARRDCCGGGGAAEQDSSSPTTAALAAVGRHGARRNPVR